VIALTTEWRDRVESHIGIAKSVALSLAGTLCQRAVWGVIGAPEGHRRAVMPSDEVVP
jgi:hypothetical protein